MSDWKAGDIAVCVTDPMPVRAPNECSVIKEKLQPTVGSQWKVDDVELHWRDEEMRFMIYLKLCGQPSDICFDERLFTKLQGVALEVEVGQHVTV